MQEASLDRLVRSLYGAPFDVWLKITISPAAASVPTRAGPESASATNVKVPSPFPDAPLVTCNHSALLVAVQLHRLDGLVVTLTRNVPPLGYPSIVDPTDNL